jgi:hypothetical protein
MLVTIDNDTKVDLTSLIGAGETDIIQIEHTGLVGKSLLCILSDQPNASVPPEDAFRIHWAITSPNSIRSVQGVIGSKVWLINPYPQGNDPITVRVFFGLAAPVDPENPSAWNDDDGWVDGDPWID